MFLYKILYNHESSLDGKGKYLGKDAPSTGHAYRGHKNPFFGRQKVSLILV